MPTTFSAVQDRFVSYSVLESGTPSWTSAALVVHMRQAGLSELTRLMEKTSCRTSGLTTSLNISHLRQTDSQSRAPRGLRIT